VPSLEYKSESKFNTGSVLFLYQTPLLSPLSLTPLSSPLLLPKLSKVPKKLWTHLMVDFIMKLPVVARKDAILVVCNRLSKIMHFVATTEGLVRLFRDNMWKLHRLPESIVSDRKLKFAAEMTKKLNSMLEIETKLSTAFYPQTNGQTERMN